MVQFVEALRENPEKRCCMPYCEAATIAFTCGPAARNMMSRKTVMPARSTSSFAGSEFPARAGLVATQLHAFNRIIELPRGLSTINRFPHSEQAPKSGKPSGEE